MEIKRNIKVGPHQKGVKDSDELPIRIRVTYNCNRVDLSTIFSVSQKNWDTNQQKVVSPKNHKNKFGQTDRYINDGIGARIGIINSIFKKYEVLNAVPTMDQLSVSSKVDFHQSGTEKGTRERVRSKVTKFGYHYKFLSSF